MSLVRFSRKKGGDVVVNADAITYVEEYSEGLCKIHFGYSVGEGRIRAFVVVVGSLTEVTDRLEF